MELSSAALELTQATPKSKCVPVLRVKPFERAPEMVQSQWWIVCAEYITKNAIFIYFVSCFRQHFCHHFSNDANIFAWPWLLFIQLKKRSFSFCSTFSQRWKLIFNEQNEHINCAICIFANSIHFRAFLLWILNERFHFHSSLLVIYKIEFK